MIYGTPADRNLARLLRWLRRFPLVPVPGGGGTLQQPVHVEDLCAAIESALVRPESAGHAYDVGGPTALSLAELVRISGAALGIRAIPVPVPLAPAHLAARAARAMRVRAPVTPEQVLRLAESKAIDITPATRDLGFQPRSFEEGIASEARAILRG
jgi:nucleoside-diphosphate-sugar epimerase